MPACGRTEKSANVGFLTADGSNGSFPAFSGVSPFAPYIDPDLLPKGSALFVLSSSHGAGSSHETMLHRVAVLCTPRTAFWVRGARCEGLRLEPRTESRTLIEGPSSTHSSRSDF